MRAYTHMCVCYEDDIGNILFWDGEVFDNIMIIGLQGRMSLKRFFFRFMGILPASAGYRPSFFHCNDRALSVCVCDLQYYVTTDEGIP